MPRVTAVTTALFATLSVAASFAAAAMAADAVFSDVKPLNANATADTGNDGNPSIAGDGKGNYVVVWESNDTLGNTIDGDADILTARSSDGGRTWTEPVALAAFAKNDNSHDAAPEIATDRKGIWAVTWSSNNSLSDKIGDDVDTLITYSNDNGATWTPPTPLYPAAANDESAESSVTLATDGKGNWGAAFTVRPIKLAEGQSVQRNIYVSFRKAGSQAWSNPTRINPELPPEPVSDSTSPSIAVDGNGRWIVAWRTVVGVKGDIYTARTDGPGSSWSSTKKVNSGIGATSRNYGSIVRSDGKSWIVAWMTSWSGSDRLGRDRDLVFVHSNDGGITWTKTKELNTDASTDSRKTNDELLTLGLSDAGWLAVWSRRDDTALHGTDNDLRAASSTDGLTWSAPISVNNDEVTDESHDLGAAVAGDASGNWVVVWARATKIPSAYGTDRDLFFTIGKTGAPKPKAGVDVARR